MESSAKATVFYGIAVRSQTLIGAALAHDRIAGGLDVLQRLQRDGDSTDSDKAALRVPPEVWERVEEELVHAAREDEQHNGLSSRPPKGCDCTDDGWEALVGVEDFTLKREEQRFPYNCEDCDGLELSVESEWEACLETDFIRRRMHTLLERYDLWQFDSTRYVKNHKSISVCFVGLPVVSRRCGNSSWRNRRNTAWVSADLRGYEHQAPELENRVFSLSTAVPADADRRFRDLINDFGVEAVADGEVELRSPGVKLSEEDEQGQVVRPAWRFSLSFFSEEDP
ncbi:hypothetical protein JCM6882_000459 [Rhodosporidiobolus microsporus]